MFKLFQKKEEPKETIKEAVIEKEESIVKAVNKSKIGLNIDKDEIKKIKFVTVAYSHIERDMFPTQDSYEAEIEVEDRAKEVAEVIEKFGINVKLTPGNQYLLTNLLVDKPDLVFNLVDTLKGKDALQTSVPAALELSNIPYTGAGMDGLVIGNDRNITKRLLIGYDIPTPAFQYIRRSGTRVQEELGTPLIVKLCGSGGSVGIDNKAVKETIKDAQRKVDKMISLYKMPVIVEQFVDGPEITVCVFDDGLKKHVFMGQKIFRKKADGKHFFTSIESYDDLKSYTYIHIEEPLRTKIAALAIRAFNALYHKDYAKFDIRYDERTNTPYFTDSNPNTAFGPDMGLPFTEVACMHKVSFEDLVASMLTKYGKQINR
jgi:D-alanine-D-alanine ligase